MSLAKLLPDAPVSVGPLRLFSRAAFLADAHGRCSLRGDVTADTTRFFTARLQSAFGLVCLGPVLIDAPLDPHQSHAPYRAHFAPQLCAASSSQRHALAQLISHLVAAAASLHAPATPLIIGCQLALPIGPIPGGPDDWRERLVRGAAQLYEAGVRCFTLCAEHVASLLYPLAHLSEDDCWRETLDAISALRAALPADAALVARVYLPVDDDAATLDTLAICVAALGPVGASILHVALHPNDAAALVGGSERVSGAKRAARLADAAGLPALYSGRARHAEDADRALRYHQLALVGLTRASLADPASFTYATRGADALHCTGCMACTPQRARATFSHAACPLQPELPPRALTAWRDRQLHIFGASAPALQAAALTAAAGAHVSLYPLDVIPGGGLRQRGRTPRQAESTEAALVLIQRCRDAGVRFVRDLLLQEPPDLPADAHVLISLPPVYLDPPAQLRGRFTGALLNGRSFYDTSTLDRSPHLIWGSGLLATELAMFLNMQAIEVALIAHEPPCSDTHDALANFYRPLLRERAIALISPHDLTIAPDGALLVKHLRSTRLILAHQPSDDHPAVAPLLARYPHAHVIADPYEPLAQRDARAQLVEFLSQ